MKSIYRLSIILLLTTITGHLLGQEVIGELEIKDFPTESPWIYPYEYVDYQSEHIFLSHQPALRVSRGEFVHLWKSEKGNYRKRMLTKYNLFMESVWEIEFKLDHEEYIFHFFKTGEQLVVLTRDYQFPIRTHRVKARIFSLEDGELTESRLLWQQKERRENYIQLDISPDSSKLMFYLFRNEHPNRRVRISTDHYLRNEREGYRYSNATELKYITYQNDLAVADSGILEVPNRKQISFHVQLDNEGNVYNTSFIKPKTLQVFQHKKGETRMLEYEEFSDLKEIKEDYTTHFPPATGDNERLYITLAERVLKGKRKGTKAFQIINFDFEKEEVDLTRKVEVTSTLLVSAEKQREKFGLRPLKRFDEYSIRDIVEMEDKSLWLITQKYQSTDYRASAGRDQALRTSYEQNIEEMVLYEFDSTGNITQVIFVPSSQRTEFLLEQISQFGVLDIDKKKKQIRWITREPSEDHLKGPDRIYYREIDLNKPSVSSRKILYEGRRRSQYFVKDYTLWLNPDIVTIMMIDGRDGKAYGVVINVEGEMNEDDKKKKKWWR